MELPVAFCDEMKRILGDEYEDYLKSMEGTRKFGLRVNTAKISVEDFLKISPFELTPIPYVKNGFYYDGEKEQPAKHPYYFAGLYYLQDPSAMTPASRLPIEENDVVLDLCAAPGGKATELAAKLHGTGFLISNDISNSRAKALLKNLELFGIGNMCVVSEAPNKLSTKFYQTFDKILIDAPCSGEGMFRKEAAAIGQHGPALVAQCAATAAGILDAAAALLAPGGVLVLSTCTFAPEEDEGQAVAFLARHPEFVQEDLSGVGFGRPGEANRAPEVPGFSAGFCRRIWPADGGEGHFIARFRKQGESPAREEPVPEKPRGGRKSGRPYKTAAQVRDAWRTFAAGWFPALADAPAEIAGDLVVLPPPVALPAAKLHILRAGVPAGKLQKGRFVPSHALFMAYGSVCCNAERLTLSDPRTAAWLRGEEIDAGTAENGWCAVLVDGFPLGCGKVSGGRVKNHYPKALRNLG